MIYRKNKLSNFLSIEKTDINKNISKETNNLFINEKSCYTKISNIFNCIFEDLFPKIISSKSKESFINETKEKSMKIIHNNYNNNDIKLPIINNIIIKVNDEIKNKINQIYSFLKKSLEDIEKKRKNICYVNHFRKHCIKSENTAYHLCDNGKLGNFIQLETNFNNEKNQNYIICQNCHFCYLNNCIKMYCSICKKSYYSSILSDKENMNILPATWDTYHCGVRKKEMMKCLKCKEILYFDLKSNRLICLNKNCNFSSKPEHIIWGCHLCGKDFKSGAKIYNPLEFIILNKVINRALLYKIKAVPPFLPCCKGKIDESTIFYHSQKCVGKLYKFNMDGRDIVVCEKCQVLNKFNYFSWYCPLCSQVFSLNNENITKKHNHTNSSLNIHTKYNNEFLKNKKTLINNDRNISTPSLKTSTNNIFGFGFIKKENQANEYAKSKSKDKRDKNNKSFDKNNITLDNQSTDRNSKSLEQNKNLRRHLRKRRTLQEILNARKDTPSFGKKRKEDSSEKSRDLTGRITDYKNKRLNTSIDNCLVKEGKNEEKNINLNVYKKRFDNDSIKNRLIFKKINSELRENNNNSNIIDDIKKVNVNKYINVMNKRNNNAKEIDINEKNQNYNNFYNINNINNINIITSIGLERSKKVDKSNTDLSKHPISKSQNLINSSDNNNIIRKSINKIMPKRYLKENKLSSMKKINPINKFIESNEKQDSNLNKTAENFYKKNMIVEPFNNEIKSNRAHYKQIKISNYYNGKSNLRTNEISEKNNLENINNNEQKIDKFTNKFNWKRNRLNDFVNNKENLETKKHKNDNNNNINFFY